MWKRIGIGVVGVVVVGVAVVLGYGATQPSTWHVERSATIDAAPGDIQPLLEDLETWPSWAAGPDADAAGMTFTYGPIRRGVGATYSWQGPGSFGTATITSSDASGVTYDMLMESSETPAHGSLRLTPDGDRTRVTWVDEGDFGMWPLGGLMVPMMEGALGPHFEGGLARLGPLAQARATQRVAMEAAAAEATAKAAAALEAAANAGADATLPGSAVGNGE
ncbi:MAG: SRPBCC family protein [Myxococcota bacterium]